MKVAIDIEIKSQKDLIWKAITEFEHWDRMISGIQKMEILNQPPKGIVGLKWRETRVMFGKEAVETMWITESKVNDYYITRAESHGSIYLSQMSLKDRGDQTLLTMTFEAIPQTTMAKVFSFLLSPLIKISIKKALKKDLEDIKAFVEKS